MPNEVVAFVSSWNESFEADGEFESWHSLDTICNFLKTIADNFNE